LRLFEITPQSFRNLSPEPVFFGAGVTLVTGENAQGKTNLLEAVALLCGQRSFRRVKPGEIAAGGARGTRMEEEDGDGREDGAAAAGGDRFSVAGRLSRGGEEETLRVTWSRAEGRSFARGEKPITFREVARLAPAVFLSPEHRELLTGGPAVRRRFLDRLVLASRPAATSSATTAP
jgi:DNA replication and repair protein RecF